MGLRRVVFFCFKSGCCRGPRAKLLDNPLVVNPPQSNHVHSLPPSMLRWLYKHLLLLEVRPVPVRQSCPAASQLLSLHRCLQTVIQPASQPASSPASDKPSSLCGYLSLQGMFSQRVKHPSPSSGNPLQFLVFSLKSAEVLTRAENRGNESLSHPQTCPAQMPMSILWPQEIARGEQVRQFIISGS